MKHKIDMDSLHDTVDLRIKIEGSTNEICNLPFAKRLKDEPLMKNGETFELTVDIKKYIKVEENILAVDVKTEEQKSEAYLDCSKLELLTEELNIKSDCDHSNDESSGSDRAAENKIKGKKHGVVQRKADNGSAICNHCNFIDHSKGDAIYPINVGNFSLEGSAKKTLIARKSSRQPNEYICIKCSKTFKLIPSVDNYVIKKYVKVIKSASHSMKHPETRHGVKRFPCIHCNKTFKIKRNLHEHIINKHDEFIGSVSSKIHQCNHCSFKTTFTSSLAIHMASKHSESGSSIEWNACTHCNAKFKNKISLVNHVIKYHRESIASYNIHQCKDCIYRTTSSTCFNKHLESRCSIKCSKDTFKLISSVDNHVLRNYEKVIESSSHSMKHPETRHSIKRLPCIHCNKTFKVKRSLDDHIIKNHDEFIGPVSSKIHQCNYCSLKTTVSSCLADHMASKHSENGSSVKRISCVHCNKTFKAKVALEDHIIQKHEELIGYVSSKIHNCNHCSFKTTIRSHLLYHLASKHSEDGSSVERISCLHCNKTFKAKVTLDDHVIQKHAELIGSVSSKIHQCSHCSFKTTIKSHLAYHMASKH